jgi:hypothetical protein
MTQPQINQFFAKKRPLENKQQITFPPMVRQRKLEVPSKNSKIIDAKDEAEHNFEDNGNNDIIPEAEDDTDSIDDDGGNIGGSIEDENLGGNEARNVIKKVDKKKR